MKTALVTEHKGERIVHLPLDCGLPVGRVSITKDEGSLVLTPIDLGWPEDFTELFSPIDFDDWHAPAREKDTRHFDF